jgi:hypothetical protein
LAYFVKSGMRLTYQQAEIDFDIWCLPHPQSHPYPLSLARSYSRDGRRIAVSSNGGVLEIWQTASDGTNPVQATSLACSWSGTRAVVRMISTLPSIPAQQAGNNDTNEISTLSAPRAVCKKATSDSASLTSATRK